YTGCSLEVIVQLSDVLHLPASIVFFFFSSRRRHTRSYGDWSSDVCSSDLRFRSAAWDRRNSTHRAERNRQFRRAAAAYFACPPRSEERRVGKECRSRWSSYD